MNAWADLARLAKSIGRRRAHKPDTRTAADRRADKRAYRKANKKLHRQWQLAWLKRNPDWHKLQMRRWRREKKMRAAA